MTEIEDVDRISSLPDEILTHILSFLETREAIATSVLSKRWEFIWTTVPVIYILEHKIQSSLSFKAFVDRVLILNDAPFLRLFRLQFTNDILHVCSWMRNVMRRNIFEIKVWRMMTLEEEKVRPLKGNLVSENLKVLKLYGDSIAPWFSLSNLFLPKLLIFHLENFDFIDDDVCLDDIFWSGLPCLEEFVISFCQNLGSVCFRSSSLRRLEIRCILTGSKSRTLIIDAPSLEYLSIDDNFLDIKLKINAPSLIEAHFGLWGYGSGIELVEILKQFPSLKTLDIFTSAELFHHFVAGLRAVIQFPLFPKLKCLDVSHFWFYRKHPSHLTIMVLLCEHAPNLVSLKYGDKDPMSDCESEEPYYYLPPTVVPKCLSSTLKVIDMYSYQMIDDVVTKYLLQYATRSLKPLESRLCYVKLASPAGCTSAVLMFVYASGLIYFCFFSMVISSTSTFFSLIAPKYCAW
ncbi:F-box/LRR-repeat protein At4g14103-like [Beta vulgaris subsp. vulgaris]|uniref:F-box/LRR-repeat protein At4g14103-like n=1 Tax=Beta vulgaris subsp. vulgaris TaxID=3555 RepID=UPI002036F2ED|nr:F-box/LRR-repeat protein At4g14103-like [Beta vulgaris subsp. vulgaris]